MTPLTIELYAKGGLKDYEVCEAIKPKLLELGITHDVTIAYSETPDGASSYYTVEVKIAGGQG